MYSLIISLVVYFISSNFIDKFLDSHLPPGLERKILVFILASLISWLVGSGIDFLFPTHAISLMKLA